MARLLGIGLLSGFFGALFGVGGGIVIVPLLVLICAFDQRRASATSLAAILVAAIAGSITYAFHGDVRPGAAALVGIPAVAGVLAGTALQQRVPQRTVSLAFAGLLVVIAATLVA